MSNLLAVARRLLLVPILAAAYGWQDLLGGLPGPRVALALPLREPSHQAAVPLVGLVAVWFAAFAIAALAVPVRRLPRPLAALLRGVVTFASVAALQALSLQLVRQAAMGFEWHAALTTATPFIAGACAAVATLVVTPHRRAVKRAADVAGDGAAATSAERAPRLTVKASTGTP
jgi:hypothetical protein